MNAYISSTGAYYEGDRVNDLDQPCARRPSNVHVFTGVVSLDPDVCWRTKTPAEVDAERQSEAATRLEGDTLVRLLFEVNWNQENRLRAIEGLSPITRAVYRNAWLNQYAQILGA